MTPEERKEQKRKQKDWVKARLNCTMKAVYDSLVDAIIYDVKIYNESIGEPCFKVKEGEQTVVEPVTEYGEKDYVAIKLQDGSVTDFV